MNRNLLLASLKRYSLSLKEQSDLNTYSQFYTFVSLHQNCLSRSATLGHITASAAVWNKEKTACLLMHHKKLSKWTQLGGHADGNPDTLAVAIKEAQEESGIAQVVPLSTDIIDLEIYYIPQYKSTPAHFHYDVRYSLIVQNNNLQKNEESNELKWVALNKIENFSSESSIIRLHKKSAALL